MATMILLDWKTVMVDTNLDFKQAILEREKKGYHGHMLVGFALVLYVLELWFEHSNCGIEGPVCAWLF